MTQSFFIISLTIGQVAQVAQATLTPTRADRGQSKVFFDIPNSGGRQEACIIPRFLPDVKYSKDALETMQELCSFNFYPSTLQSGQRLALACQKLNSTNPGLNIYDLSETIKNYPDKKIDCSNVDLYADKDIVEKAGKYKQSTSCSYTPGILAYFHVSQALGKVAQVPEAVLRTLDLDTHLEIGNDAMDRIQYVKQHDSKLYQQYSMIDLTLGSLIGKLQNPTGKHHDLLITDGYKEGYGAFLVNPSREDRYSELFVAPTTADSNAANAVLANAQPNLKRAFAFKRAQPHYQLLKNPGLISTFIPAEMNQYDTLINMRDIADMIVIDTIMSQEDRFGNIAFQPFKAVLLSNGETQKIELVKPKNYDKKIAELNKEGFSVVSTDDVKQMILKDNDCSVSRTNVLGLAGLVKELRHIDPKTYHHLLKFNASLDNPAVKSIFRVDFYFTEADYTKMKQNANQVTQILKQNCNSGALKLDLDIEGYMETGKVAQQSCN